MVEFVGECKWVKVNVDNDDRYEITLQSTMTLKLLVFKLF